jgi:hypothetical protein
MTLGLLFECLQYTIVDMNLIMLCHFFSSSSLLNHHLNSTSLSMLGLRQLLPEIKIEYHGLFLFLGGYIAQSQKVLF